MSEAVALKTGIPWDSTVILGMQSANGQINASLGLTHNIPFQFAGITLYLQVHIICEAAYDILLGRPFEDIMHAVTRNLEGGNQTITITCPNTKMVITMPTFERSDSNAPPHNHLGFH